MGAQKSKMGLRACRSPSEESMAFGFIEHLTIVTIPKPYFRCWFFGVLRESPLACFFFGGGPVLPVGFHQGSFCGSGACAPPGKERVSLAIYGYL